MASMGVTTGRGDELLKDGLSPRVFDQLRDLIRSESGITLGPAKRELLCSRLARRVRELGLRGYDDYYQYLLCEDSTGAELQQMVNCITTTKTDFFRENHHFEYLRDQAFRQWRARAAETADYQLRIWSTASSRGHEPYSVAITLLEHFGPRACWDIKILATDINTNVLSLAERGIYPMEEADCVPREIRDRYFMRGTGCYARTCRVREELRRLIAFRAMNLMAPEWPFQGRFDAIFCRNVLIYFDESSQRQLVARLSNQLVPGGYLFLGHSEHQAWLASYVEPLGQTIYRKRGS